MNMKQQTTSQSGNGFDQTAGLSKNGKKKSNRRKRQLKELRVLREAAEKKAENIRRLAGQVHDASTNSVPTSIARVQRPITIPRGVEDSAAPPLRLPYPYGTSNMLNQRNACAQCDGQGQYPMGHAQQANDVVYYPPTYVEEEEDKAEETRPATHYESLHEQRANRLAHAPAYAEKVRKAEEAPPPAHLELFQKPLIPQPLVPEPTEKYLAQASSQPRLLPSRQPLLVILDLNGTLIYRNAANPYSFLLRQASRPFLCSILEKYKVMIWSSARPQTVNTISSGIFTGDQKKTLVAEWGRDKFGLTPAQYKEKVQVYKRLDTVWNDDAIQASYPKYTGNGKTLWDQSNTVLIDDSPLKAAAQPFNIMQVPEYAGGNEPCDVLGEVAKKLDTLASFDDVSKVMRHWTYRPGDDAQSITILAHQQTKRLREEAEENVRLLKKERLRVEQRAMDEERKKNADRTHALADAERVEEQLLSEISDRSKGGSGGGATTESNEHQRPTADGCSGNENYLLDRLEEALGLKNL